MGGSLQQHNGWTIHGARAVAGMAESRAHANSAPRVQQTAPPVCSLLRSYPALPAHQLLTRPLQGSLQALVHYGGGPQKCGRWVKIAANQNKR